jgi:hypothetical protein
MMLHDLHSTGNEVLLSDYSENKRKTFGKANEGKINCNCYLVMCQKVERR